MKSNPIVLTICIALVFSLTGRSLAKYSLAEPVSGEKVRLMIGGKHRTYWKLDGDKSLTLRATGPAKIKLITRMVLPAKKNEGLYGIVVMEDGVRDIIGRGTTASKSAVNPKAKSQRIGASRSIYLKVPDGTHEYVFALFKNGGDDVFVRPLILSESLSADEDYIAYLPRSFPEEVEVIVKEREYIYYRCDKGRSAVVEVIGPTRIKVLSRLEFDHSIRGDKPYRVQVLENGEVIQTQPMKGVISGIASYKNVSKQVPGRANTFYIEVPAGAHRYNVMTPDAGVTVLLRFYIPKSDLGNESSGAKGERARSFGFSTAINQG